MGFTLELPPGALAEDLLATVQGSETPAVANHSVRTFFFAQLLAAHEGCLGDAEYDVELLYAATVLHDLGTGDLARGETRFEVEGADLAADLLRRHNIDEQRIDRVWQAIALHTSPGIAERRGLLAYLTRGGIRIDFGSNVEVVAAWEQQIHAAYPRLSMARSLVDAIVERAGRSAAAAPPFSFPNELLRERRASGTTSIETAAANSPWGQ